MNLAFYDYINFKVARKQLLCEPLSHYLTHSFTALCFFNFLNVVEGLFQFKTFVFFIMVFNFWIGSMILISPFIQNFLIKRVFLMLQHYDDLTNARLNLYILIIIMYVSFISFHSLNTNVSHNICVASQGFCLSTCVVLLFFFSLGKTIFIFWHVVFSRYFFLLIQGNNIFLYNIYIQLRLVEDLIQESMSSGEFDNLGKNSLFLNWTGAGIYISITPPPYLCDYIFPKLYLVVFALTKKIFRQHIPENSWLLVRMPLKKNGFNPPSEHFWDNKYKNNLDFFPSIKKVLIQTLAQII